MLRAQSGPLALRPGKPDSRVWSFGSANLAFKRGDRARIAFTNDLSTPMALVWRGIDGEPSIEPLLARAPKARGGNDTLEFSLSHAGTNLCDLALLGDGAPRPARALPLIVAESEPVPVDRDEVLLIEGWRVRQDGAAIAPGLDPAGTDAVYTVNGEVAREIHLRRGERVRIRFISGLQRTMIAVKIERHQVMVMALDGQPAEPFLARNGAFALAPGGRADVFVDAMSEAGTASIQLHDGDAARTLARLITSDEPPIRKDTLPPAKALPSNGLPDRLDLKSALRVDINFDGYATQWVRPNAFSATAAPAFSIKPGRVVVLSLINHASNATVFHVHGHHFRLLDRLDDGWKPFWLDTIAVDAGKTQRIALAAEHAGRWLIEAVETRWEAQRLVRWFNVG